MRLGIVQLPLAGTEKKWVTKTTDGHGVYQLDGTSYVAATNDHLFAASEAFTLGWKRISPGGNLQVTSFFEFVGDIDAHQDRFAVLGLRRGLFGTMSPEGGIAWLGAVNEKVPQPNPLLISASGPGAELTDNCASFQIGAVRFLEDGRLVVVPGSEPGAYLYSKEGALLEAWDTLSLAINPNCSFDEEFRDLLSINLAERRNYLSRFRTVDEILILDGIPHLIVRQTVAKGTRWELIALEPRGQTTRKPLPIQSPSKWAHIRGDVRDGKLVLLIFDELILLPLNHPLRTTAEASRLVVLEQRERSREVKEPQTSSPSGEPRADPAQ